MKFNAVQNILMPTLCGYGLLTSKSYSNALGMAIDDQPEMVTFDNIANIALLVIATNSNLKFLYGDAFASRFYWGSYAVYPLMGGLHALSRIAYQRQYVSRTLETWDTKRFSKESAEDNRSLGKRVEDALSGSPIKSKLTNEINKLCPEKGQNSSRSIETRIDEAFQNAPLTSMEKNACAVMKFVQLHILDGVILFSAFNALKAGRLGFNSFGNSIYILFCLWTLLEQGVFWMHPTEDGGPLFKMMGGKIPRLYHPFLDRLDPYLGAAFKLFCKGIPGKFLAVMGLVSKIASSSLKKKMQLTLEQLKLEKRKRGESEREIEYGRPGTPLQEMTPRGMAPTEKHFVVYKLNDLYPTETLSAMELKLQGLLEKDRTPFMESSGGVPSAQLTNRKKLEFILGKAKKKGFLHEHVIATTEPAVYREKVIELKIIFGKLIEDWNTYKTCVVGYHQDFLCRTATGRAIKDLALELYAPSGQSANTKKVEQKVALIFQQYRDRHFIKLIQKLVAEGGEAMMEHEHKLKEQRGRANHTETSDKQWRESLKKSVEKIMMQGLMKYAQYVMSVIGTSRHQVNFMTYICGGGFGLSASCDARRDTKTLLSKFFGVDISFYDALLPIYEFQMGPLLKGEYLENYRRELLNAIQSDGDGRLSTAEIEELILEIAKRSECEEVIREEMSEYAQYKPSVYRDRGKEVPVGNPELYVQKRKEFLEKYLDAVLVETGFLGSLRG